MKKWTCWILIVLIIFNYYVIAMGAGMNQPDKDYVILTFNSPFLSTEVKKKAYRIEDELLMDIGTLADLTGYTCGYWNGTVIFERGFRRITVKSDGAVNYSGTDYNLQLEQVVEIDGFIYIPLLAGLKLLGGAEVSKGNRIFVICNELSLFDKPSYWDMTNMAMNYERDLPINSVNATKLGIFISTIFDQGSRYIINIINGRGPNSDKYRDAAIYYLTYNSDSQALSAVEKEAEGLDSALAFFGSDLNDIVIDEIDRMPACLGDMDFLAGLKGLNAVSKINDIAKPVLQQAILYSKLKTAGAPQIKELKMCVTGPDGNHQSGLGLSFYTGILTAIEMAEEKYELNVAPALTETTLSSLEWLVSGKGSLVLSGFSVGNTIMQTAFSNTFDKMDKYDLLFCLKDMQDKTLVQYNKCRDRILGGSSDVNDYKYVYYAMQFFKNSNQAICQLLTEVYSGDGNDENVKTILSYWKTRAESIHNNYYISRITLDECIRDAIPTALPAGQIYNVSETGNLQGNLNNLGFVASGVDDIAYLSMSSGVWTVDDSSHMEKIYDSPLYDMNVVSHYLFGTEYHEETGVKKIIKLDLQDKHAEGIMRGSNNAYFTDLFVTDQYLYYISPNDCRPAMLSFSAITKMHNRGDLLHLLYTADFCIIAGIAAMVTTPTRIMVYIN